MPDPKVVKVKPWSEVQGEYVLINEEDFNDEVHELFEQPVEKEITVPKMKKALKEAGIDFDPNGKREDIEPAYLKLIESNSKAE